MLSLTAIAVGITVWLLQTPSPLQRLKPGNEKTLSKALQRLVNWTKTVPTTQRLRQANIASQDLPLIADLLAVCLEAGMPLRSAVAAYVEASSQPAAVVLTGVLARIQIGIDEKTAWDEVRAVSGWEALASQLSFSAAAGTSTAAALRMVSASMRKAAAACAGENARSVGVKIVFPLTLCFLPAFILLGIVPIIGGIVSGVFG
ncbi:MAG: type II secretion system F family protein [Propionibacteriaceae bacterium]|nr:type II secretion system F family protein [Propionibacteriaceae bacterium]